MNPVMDSMGHPLAVCVSGAVHLGAGTFLVMHLASGIFQVAYLASGIYLSPMVPFIDLPFLRFPDLGKTSLYC